MTEVAASNETIECRLCHASAAYRFSATVLRRHSTQYYCCAQCGSLETAPPHWLAEAYADRRPVRDVWMVSRTESMRTLVLWTLQILGKTEASVCDWGGGNGLLVRMLRDAGVNAVVSDKYATNYYAVGFELSRAQPTDVMTAFEVFEHADDPCRLMMDMCAHGPELILLSTEMYAGQGTDWDYLHKDSGKHVFFYTAKGLTLLAEQFGYGCLPGEQYTLMYKQPLKPWQVAALRTLLGRFGKMRSLLGLADLLRWRRKPGAARDYARLIDRGLI